jgi:hypothetical protein
MMTREEWPKGTGTAPTVNGLVKYTNGSRWWGEPGLESIDSLGEED